MLPLDKAIELEKGRNNAWLIHDQRALSNILHDDYLETNIFGRFNKKQVVYDLFPKVQMLKYDMTEGKVLDTGADSCTLNYRVSEQLKSDGQVLSFDCYVTSIYKREGDRWLLLLWQITPLNR